MNALIFVSVAVSIVILVVVISPFFFGKSGRLEDASSVNSEEKLSAVKEVVLKHWQKEFLSYKEGLITEREWRQRKVYLTNRYVDAARRLDWLKQRGGV